MHPRVAADYQEWLNRRLTDVYVLKEAALLFESGSYRTLDKTIVVSAPRSLREKRVLLRDVHRTVEQFRQIVEKQMPEDEKLKRADYIIVNDDANLVIPQVLKLHDWFKQGTG